MKNFYLPHIAITVSDIETTKDFYSKIGFVIKKEMYSEEKKRHFLLIEGYGFEMEIFYFEDQEPDQEAKTDLKTVGLQHFALPVENLELVRSSLLDNGIELTKDISESSLGVKHINITDPSGLTIEFFQK